MAKHLSQYTFFFSIWKPFEPNIDFYQNPDLGWNFPTLPWDKKEGASSKEDFYHLLVSDVHQNKKKKHTKNKSHKEKKGEKRKEQKKSINQNRKGQKENKFFGANNVWIMYKFVVKSKRRGNNSNLIKT